MGFCKNCGTAVQGNEPLCPNCKPKNISQNEPENSAEQESSFSAEKLVFEESFGKESIGAILDTVLGFYRNTKFILIGGIVLCVLGILFTSGEEHQGLVLLAIALGVLLYLLKTLKIFFEFFVSMIENVRRSVDNSHNIGLLLQKYVVENQQNVTANYEYHNS